MKKILLTASILLLSLTALAQNEHLSFKGVPIDGPRKTFISEMREKGFEYVGDKEDISVLTGDFAGYKNCSVAVTTLTNKDLVAEIIVIFPDKTGWAALESDYDNLLEMLTLKYGKPSVDSKEWENCNPEDDMQKLYQLAMDRCKYGALFETEHGTIELMLTRNDFTSGCAILRYRDKTNRETIYQAAVDDL